MGPRPFDASRLAVYLVIAVLSKWAYFTATRLPAARSKGADCVRAYSRLGFAAGVCMLPGEPSSVKLYNRGVGTAMDPRLTQN